MRKNVAGQVVGAQLVSATDGSAFTGSVTAYITGDGGTQAVGSVGSGACTHKGNGYHTYPIAQAETNYDLVAVTFTGTGAVPVTIQYATTPATGILAPTVADRTLDVTATGAAGIDWGNVENQATSVDLSATAINLCDTVTVNSDMRGTDSASTHSAADVWSVATRVLTAGTNIGFPTVGQIADAVWDEPGADHLTTGTTGEAQYFTDFNVSALPNASANATAVWAAATRTLTAGTNIGFPTTSQIADGVWDEAISGHLTGGSTGAALNAAGSAGDPWTTTLPGSYTGSQAGKILADVLTDTGTTIPATLADIQGATFDSATDSLEAIRNRGDLSWITATGFSTHSAADVASAVWDKDTLSHNSVGSFGRLVGLTYDNTVTQVGQLTTIDGIVDQILVDTGTTIPGLIANLPTDADVNAQCDTAISDYFGTAGSSLTAIPWNAAWDAQVQSECEDAINSLFTFTAAGFVDANIQKINDVDIVGNGVSPKFGV